MNEASIDFKCQAENVSVIALLFFFAFGSSFLPLEHSSRTDDVVLAIEFKRLDGDTVADEIFLTIREKRG